MDEDASNEDRSLLHSNKAACYLMQQKCVSLSTNCMRHTSEALFKARDEDADSENWGLLHSTKAAT